MEGCGRFAVVCQSTLELLFSSCTGNLLMLLESFLKALSVYSKAMLLGQLLGKLDGETISIIKLEGDTASDYSALSFEKVWK